MRHIKSTLMTVSDLIGKLRTRSFFTEEHDQINHRVNLTFATPLTWSDGREKIASLSAEYDANTQYVQRITIIGSDLIQIIGYTYMNECYLWFTIKDMNQFDFEHIEDIPGKLIINV